MRQFVEISDDQRGIAHLIALSARPPWRKDEQRPNRAIQVIRQVSAYGFYDTFGYEHPGNPRSGNRKRADREQSLRVLFLQFQKAVAAGRMFHASLRSKDMGLDEFQRTRIKLNYGIDTFILDVSAETHLDAINFIISQDKNIIQPDDASRRTDLWDKWIKTIHISAAFAMLYDSNKHIQKSITWIEFCRALLFQPSNDALARWLVKWANEFEEAAETATIFQRSRLIGVRLAAPKSAVLS